MNTGRRCIKELEHEAEQAGIRLSDAFLLAGIHPCNISRWRNAMKTRPREKNLSAVKKALSILSERKPCPPQDVPPLTEYSCVSFGYTLTILRRAQGLTPRKVAEFLGVSREHLEAIETGAELPDICLTRKLAEILGCSLKYLTVHHIRDQLRRSGLKLEGRIRVA